MCVVCLPCGMVSQCQSVRKTWFMCVQQGERWEVGMLESWKTAKMKCETKTIIIFSMKWGMRGWETCVSDERMEGRHAIGNVFLVEGREVSESISYRDGRSTSWHKKREEIEKCVLSPFHLMHSFSLIPSAVREREREGKIAYTMQAICS